jgi:2-methylfumaryl-CoA hydratase
LGKAQTSMPGVGAIRLRLVATKGEVGAMTLRDEDGSYRADILLDLDYWAYIPL